MNYHNIKTCDMLNGEGLRTTLFVSGCNHKCKNCQNPITWDSKSGIPFDTDAKIEIINSLNHAEVSGLTISGGDPLYPSNRDEIFEFLKMIKYLFPNKNIWMYTGYTFEELMDKPLVYNGIFELIDVLVDGEFINELKDIDLKWIGSSNQRILDVKKSLAESKPILYIENSNDFTNENSIRKSY